MNASTSELLKAARAFLDARARFAAWGIENPGASGSRFSEEADKVDLAEAALRHAIAKAQGR